MIYKKVVKRPMDFILSLVAIIVLLPILIVIAILIKFNSKGPILFKQKRPGLNMNMFEVYKFRTMVEDAVKGQKIGIEVTNGDSRITSIGKFLRRFKMDELVQLLNILKGDMSIVGPRPTLPDYIDKYEEWELERFKVRPGLTGLAQTNGNIFLNQQEKSKYDIKYVDNINFVTDVQLILKTIIIVILGEEKFVKKIDDNDTREDR